MLRTVLVAYQKSFTKTSAKNPDGSDAKDGTLVVRANAELLIPDEIVDWFNIPLPAAGPQPASGPPRSIVKQHTRTVYSGISDTTGTTVTVPEYERDPNAKMEVIKRVARLEHTTLKIGTSSRPRTMSIRFPNFFNMIMISQALGSMIQNNNPGTFQMDGGGGRFALVTNTTTDVYPGYKTGAWVVTEKIPVVNADDTSASPTTKVPGRTSRKRTTT